MNNLIKTIPFLLLLTSCQSIQENRTPQSVQEVENINCSIKDGIGTRYNKISMFTNNNLLFETHPRRSIHELEEVCNFIEIMNSYSKKQGYPLVLNEFTLYRLKDMLFPKIFTNLPEVISLMSIKYLNRPSYFTPDNAIVFMDGEVISFKSENKGLQMYVNGDPFFHLKMKERKAIENTTILSLKVKNLNKENRYLTFSISGYNADNSDASRIIKGIPADIINKN